MLDIIIRKVLWVLGTILLVSIIIFFLNKRIPGDRVESILRYQGLTMMDVSPEYYKKEYDKLADQLGENLPVFYFSILPSYKEIQPYTEENLRVNAYCEKLSSYQYAHQELTDFAHSLVQLENYCIQYSVENSRSYFGSLYTENGLDNWPVILENWQLSNDDEVLYNLTQNIYEDIVKVKKSKVHFYHPKLTWNGISNQYHQWAMNLFSNRLGQSIIDGQDVTSKIWVALQWTLLLVLISLLISLVISILLSLLMIKYRNSALSDIIMGLLNSAYAIPIFWTATIFIVFFTTKEYGSWTDWFPSPIPEITDGTESVLSVFFSRIHYMVLPIICIILKEIPVFTKLIFVGLEGEMQKPYAISLRGKGLKEHELVLRHFLPNSLIPVITMVGNYLPGSLAGSLIIEVIFNIPGMGRLLFSSLFNGDFDICFGVLFLITLVTIVVLALSDIFYTWVNPKIKFNT